MTNDFVNNILKSILYNSDESASRLLEEVKEHQKCVWTIGKEKCDGEFSYVTLFDRQIAVIVCDKHFEQHIKVMMLHKFVYNIDEILADLDALFAKTFESNDVNRDSCIKFLTKLSIPTENKSDEELINEMSRFM